MFDRKIYSITEMKNVAPLALSFVGDAVHTLIVRNFVFGLSPYKNNELHKLAGEECCATAQAKRTKILVPLLNEDETFIYKKGKNAKVNSIPKHASLAEYKLATGFEAVIGFLYLTGQDERISLLIKAVYADWGTEKETSGTQNKTTENN